MRRLHKWLFRAKLMTAALAGTAAGVYVALALADLLGVLGEEPRR